MLDVRMAVCAPHSRVLADEDHLSVNPSAFSRGLLWALPR